MNSDEREYTGRPATGLATDRTHVLRLPGWEVVRIEAIDEGPVPEPLPAVDEEDVDDWEITDITDSSEEP